MRRIWRLLLAVVLVAGAMYLWRDFGRANTSGLERDAAGPMLRVRILGDSNDARIPAAREAIAYWNREFLRLGRRTHFDSGTVSPVKVQDELLRAASKEAGSIFGRAPATSRLVKSMADEPADIIVALSQTDLISFSVRWRSGSRGVVGVRRADIPPLSLPNTVRNVIAHELGHVLGLDHNRDSTTLMCGRPAPCRPAAFASESARFFPLTQADAGRLRARWP